MNSASAIQQVLAIFDDLSMEDKEAVLDIVTRRLVDLRRDEIAKNAERTMRAVKEGRAKYGTAQDLERDLRSG